MQSGVPNALHGAPAHAPTHATLLRGQRPRTATRTAVREVCEPPEIGSAVVSDRRTVPQYQQLVQSRAGAPCATHGAPQYRATRLPHPPSELSRDCSRISPLPRNRLTRSARRLKSTRSSSVTGNFTASCSAARVAGGRIAAARQREGDRPDGAPARAGGDTVQYQARARPSRSAAAAFGRPARSRHQGGPPGGQRRGLLT